MATAIPHTIAAEVYVLGHPGSYRDAEQDLEQTVSNRNGNDDTYLHYLIKVLGPRGNGPGLLCNIVNMGGEITTHAVIWTRPYIDQLEPFIGAGWQFVRLGHDEKLKTLGKRCVAFYPGRHNDQTRQALRRVLPNLREKVDKAWAEREAEFTPPAVWPPKLHDAT